MNLVPQTIDTSQLGWENHLIILGAILLPGFIAFIWAAFFRSSRKSRRRRRRERRMNPTLEQTGGLPPIRNSENSPDQPKY